MNDAQTRVSKATSRLQFRLWQAAAKIVRASSQMFHKMHFRMLAFFRFRQEAFQS